MTQLIKLNPIEHFSYYSIYNFGAGVRLKKLRGKGCDCTTQILESSASEDFTMIFLPLHPKLCCVWQRNVASDCYFDECGSCSTDRLVEAPSHIPWLDVASDCLYGCIFVRSHCRCTFRRLQSPHRHLYDVVSGCVVTLQVVSAMGAIGADVAEKCRLLPAFPGLMLSQVTDEGIAPSALIAGMLHGSGQCQAVGVAARIL
uniref:Uncharacterized protein n=1 Tax=Graphocephala atropunctata TaxID=36148 RepID=A0A1B6LB07_9HEMI